MKFVKTSIKGHNSVEKFGKISCFSHYTAYTNFIKIHRFGLKILNGNKILTSIQDHNSVEKDLKIICHCPYHILSISMHLQNFIRIHELVHKILSINKILTSIKGHNSVENEQKILFNHPNLHLVNINACKKSDRNPQINSQDIEHKLLTSIKGDNSVKNWPKIMCIRNNMDLVYINAYAQFYRLYQAFRFLNTVFKVSQHYYLPCLCTCLKMTSAFFGLSSFLIAIELLTIYFSNKKLSLCQIPSATFFTVTCACCPYLYFGSPIT